MSVFDIYLVCNSNLENRMLTYVINKIKRGFVLEVKVDELAKNFNTSKKTATLFMQKIKKSDLLDGDRGHYKTNPYLFIPYGTSNEEIEQAQRDWSNK